MGIPKTRYDARGLGVDYWCREGQRYPDALIFQEEISKPFMWNDGPFDLSRFIPTEKYHSHRARGMDALVNIDESWRDAPRGGAVHWRSIEEQDNTPADEYDRRNMLGRFYHLRYADDPLLAYKGPPVVGFLETLRRMRA